MNRQRLWLLAIVIGAVLVSAGYFIVIRVSNDRAGRAPEATSSQPATPTATATTPPTTAATNVRTDLSRFNSKLAVSAELPPGWLVSYVAATEAVAFFPSSQAASHLDNAAIFIRYFEASQFLALSTVNVLGKTELIVNNHTAVRYDIAKKSGVSNFANQPDWRSERHTVTDIRASSANPSLFLVVAHNPTLAQADYDRFLNSVQFYNDPVSFLPPLDRASERVTKKLYGTKVSPTDSPVTPERFSGYHAGLDFEVFPHELTSDVSVVAFCGGTVKTKQTVSGFGGVVVQDCKIENQTVTVVYGHLKLSSVLPTINQYLAPGAVLGLLGDDKSSQTDGERKHLHFAIHKGSSTNLKGYVTNQADLADWIDPKTYF